MVVIWSIEFSPIIDLVRLARICRSAGKVRIQKRQFMDLYPVLVLLIVIVAVGETILRLSKEHQLLFIPGVYRTTSDHHTLIPLRRRQLGYRISAQHKAIKHPLLTGEQTYVLHTAIYHPLESLDLLKNKAFHPISVSTLSLMHMFCSPQCTARR
jgi:hypothetical protein